MRSAAGYNEHDAGDALHHLDPACERTEWVKLAMAAKDAGLDFATFDAWSAQAPNYSERDTRDVWRSVKLGGGIGAGTLFMTARRAGWTPHGRNSITTPTIAPTRPVGPPRPQRLGMGPAEVWDRCQPATEGHGYIAAKKGSPTGLRIVPDGDPLTVGGLSMVGALVVPVLPLLGGDPVSLQFIATPEMAARWKAADRPSKLNLPGAKIDGMFVVGEMERGSVVNVCEGIGQAWACWRATGYPSVVCFGSGRMSSVAAELRLRDPVARLVLVPDVGKEREVEAIARDVQGMVAYMPEGWGENSDVNDLGLSDGFDAVEEILCRAAQPPWLEQRFKLMGSADLRLLPQLMWRVRSVFPAHGLAGIYGPSGAGKSFLVLDVAARIAEGGHWFGHRVTPCPVVYVCLEGAAGLRLRVEAWEQHNGRKLPGGLHIVVDTFKLTEAQDVAAMSAAVLAAGVGAVTFIDTLNASAPGIDENSSRDMGHVLEAAKSLQAMTSGLVVLVHHTGKDHAKGMRGHSSLIAALDAAVEVGREGKGRQWRIAKSKDGADGAVRPFTLDVVDLPPDRDGEPVSSCVVGMGIAGAAGIEEIKQVKVPAGANQRFVLDRIRDLFTVKITAPPGVPGMRPSLELEIAVAAGAAHLTCTSDRRTTRARAAITGLVNRGYLGLNDGWLWIA